MAKIKLSNNKRRQLCALVDHALALAGKGQLDIACRICARADTLYEDFPDTMYARGLIAFNQQDIDVAADWFGRACAALPRRVEFLVNYAGCLRLQGKEEQASEFYRQALTRAPRLSEAALGYGSSMVALGEFRQAIRIFEKALIHNPCNVEILKKLALVRSEMMENEASIALLERAHTITPQDASILYEMGVNFVQMGAIERARSCFREVLAVNPSSAEALSMLTNSGSCEVRKDDMAALSKLYHQKEAGNEQRTVAAFALGNEADRCGCYEQAFEYWAEGNRQRKTESPCTEEQQEILHRTAAAEFPASRFEEPVAADACDIAPLFIVGMPRSGSTLLEQALSRHPKLLAAGEMYAMQQSIVGRKHQASNPETIERLAALDDDGLLAVGHEYARRLLQEYQLEGRIIDKALNNYVYAGLIARALPKARIIHIRRNPFATCLSIFQQDFVNTLPYACDVEHTGREYARYQKLMQHWREVLPAGTMLEVSYEDLVNNPEPELRRLLEGCDLEWHPDCLTSHKSAGVVTTASLIQVRKPMHQKSVARWKHYEKQLSPLKQYLQL
ncbi:MAG: sulfotransferase [Mariprofundus sp.]